MNWVCLKHPSNTSRAQAQFSVPSKYCDALDAFDCVADDVASRRSSLRKRAMVKPFQPKLVWSYKVHWGFSWHHPTDLVSSSIILVCLYFWEQPTSRGVKKHQEDRKSMRDTWISCRSIPGEGRPGWCPEQFARWFQSWNMLEQFQNKTTTTRFYLGRLGWWSGFDCFYFLTGAK